MDSRKNEEDLVLCTQSTEDGNINRKCFIGLFCVCWGCSVLNGRMERSWRMLLRRNQIGTKFLPVDLLMVVMTGWRIRCRIGRLGESVLLLLLLHLLIVIHLVMAFLIGCRPFIWTLNRIAVNRSVSRIFGCVAGRDGSASATGGSAGRRRLHLILLPAGSLSIRSRSLLLLLLRRMLNRWRYRRNLTSRLINRFQLIRFRFGTIRIPQRIVDRWFSCRRQQRRHIRWMAFRMLAPRSVNALRSIDGWRWRSACGVNAFRPDQIDIAGGQVSALRWLQLSAARSVHLTAGRLDSRMVASGSRRFGVDGLRPVEIGWPAGRSGRFGSAVV